MVIGEEGKRVDQNVSLIRPNKKRRRPGNENVTMTHSDVADNFFFVLEAGSKGKGRQEEPSYKAKR